jgi:hypothetical protein
MPRKIITRPWKAPLINNIIIDNLDKMRYK